MSYKQNKGHKMEETLRKYFAKAGYFVVRGVPFRFDNELVTDIDLWLYEKSFSMSRQITIVDIKYKKTPQAIERLFWTHGLKATLKVDKAIVATTDKRKAIKELANKLDIVVLDGNFLLKIQDSIIDNNRIDEEDFIKEIENYSLNKHDGDWKGKYIESKLLLTKKLNFNTANSYIEISHFFLKQLLSKPSQRILALRLFFLIISYLAITIDFIMKDTFILDPSEKKRIFNEGFNYGSQGDIGMKKIINTSLELIEQNIPEGSSISNQLKRNIENKINSMRTEILSEFFSNNDINKHIFNIARELESMAMSKKIKKYNEIDTNTKSYIFCLMDFWSIERKKFVSIINSLNGEHS